MFTITSCIQMAIEHSHLKRITAQLVSFSNPSLYRSPTWHFPLIRTHIFCNFFSLFHFCCCSPNLKQNKYSKLFQLGAVGHCVKRSNDIINRFLRSTDNETIANSLQFNWIQLFNVLWRYSVCVCALDFAPSPNSDICTGSGSGLLCVHCVHIWLECNFDGANRRHGAISSAKTKEQQKSEHERNNRVRCIDD